MSTAAKLAPDWIYSMADYCQMFDLKDNDMRSTLLDYPAGISSFNMEMHQKGYQVLSGDKHYQMSIDTLTAFSQRIFDTNATHLKQHADILCDSQDVASILTAWEKRRNLFLQDYESGKAAGRYQFMSVPRLPFDNQWFDLALCSDHLFHSNVVKQENQLEIIKELCRVAQEVRIFPLQNEKGEVADTLGYVMLDAQQKGCGIEVREVPYHEMKGKNAMLRIWATQCVIDHQ